MGLSSLIHPHELYGDGGLSIGLMFCSVLHILLCFVLLGVCASDFLCPNVAKITDSSGNLRSNSTRTGMLMAIILSWCNSSPDLFSNLMSWTSSSDESFNVAANLSVGEVLGACGIILCVVVGSIFFLMGDVTIEITTPQRINILYDLFYTWLALTMMLYVTLRDSITIWNCFSMLSIYVGYILHKIKFSRRNSHDSESSDVNQLEEGAVDGIQREYQTFGGLESTLKPNVLAPIDFNSLLSMLENSTSPDAELQSIRNELQSSTSHSDSHERPFSDPNPQGNSQMMGERQTQSSPIEFGRYYDDPEDHRNDAQNIIQRELTTAQSIIDAADERRFLKIAEKYFLKVVPHMKSYSKKTIPDQIISTLIVPFVLLFRLTCPQPDDILEYSEKTGTFKYKKSTLSVLLLQLVFSPVLTYLLISSLLERSMWSPFLILPGLFSFTCAVLVIQFSRSLSQFNRFSLVLTESLGSNNDEELRKRRELIWYSDLLKFILLTFGIVNSILWISSTANSVIEILELYQKQSGISPAILGLTVFAWGNSISDLISNIAMCKLYKKMPHGDSDITLVATKFFMIACTSCIGGVLLNSMVGIGFSGLISMLFVHKGQGNWWFQRQANLDTTKTNNLKFLVCSLVLEFQCAFLVCIFASKGRLREVLSKNMKYLGITMCSLWALATLMITILEIA